jgi:predicted metal-dependent phosphoesterase TrpH
MSGIDLHVHTNHSDGTLTPREVVTLAGERGLDALAITDHDTTTALGEAAALGAAAGIAVVPGIEFSTIYGGDGVHVLCYFMDPGDPALVEELQRLRDDRERRGDLMVEKLVALGYPVTFERVKRIAGDAPIVRPHIAQALVEAGVVPDTRSAFTEEFIGSDGRAYVEKHALHPLDALGLIHGAGGVCVLAHPGTFRETNPVPSLLIEELAAAGLDGIEAAHPEHTEVVEARYVDLAEALDLLWTGGSDCHGALYEPVRLGCRSTTPEQFERLEVRAAELAAARAAAAR